MAIQKSVLSNGIISDFLKRRYNISTDRVEKQNLGTANCYKIYGGSKRFFLKEYQDTFSEIDLKCEILLNDFLISVSYPTAAIISDIYGNKYNSVNGRYIVLQEFIEGDSYTSHNLPDTMLFQAAELLGRLHEILCNYELPVDMDRVWVDKFNIDRARKGYDLLIEHTDEISDKAIAEKVKSDLMFKKELLSVILPYGQYFNRLTYKSTHGDYTAMQYLCSDNSIKAIIDFASATKVPAVWEIMRSYMQSAMDTKNPFEFDSAKFGEYVRHYLKLSSISEDDLKYMPYVYLYQLGRSSYGYREYMLNVENKDKLLEFAFWRTDVCRMLVEKADQISQVLIKIKRL